MNVLLSNHYSCLNRGCEALVRTTAAAVATGNTAARIRLPSLSPEYDADCLADSGLAIDCSHHHRPLAGRALRRIQERGLVGSDRRLWPLPVPPAWRRELAASDLVLSIGGDNYTLDYGPPTLSVGFDQCAARLGCPVVLWGASVGPFRARPAYERALARGLARYALITVRESASEAELRDRLGLENVIRMRDPGFELAPQPVADPRLAERLANPDERRIGLNLSPLIADHVAVTGSFRREAGALIRSLLARTDARLLLIPHVAHPAQTGKTGDHAFMAELLRATDLTSAQGERITLIPENLRAAEYKGIVGQCTCLVAARTHLAIAAYAQAVPVVALGYSRKAEAIDRDIYGDASLHIPATQFSAARVDRAVQAALANADDLAERAHAFGRGYAVAECRARDRLWALMEQGGA